MAKKGLVLFKTLEQIMYLMCFRDFLFHIAGASILAALLNLDSR
jgi:hypothetical protein